MTTRIADITIYGPGDDAPAAPEGYSISRQIIDWLEAGAYVAILDDGTWAATYVPGYVPGPGEPGARWDSLDDFHRWIRWARS